LAKRDGLFDGRVAPEGVTFQLQYSNGASVATSRLVTAVTSREYETLALPIHGGDWALARLEEPLGRKFGYLELANVALPVGFKVQALGYSKGGNEEHPGIDPDCQIGSWDTETSRKFRALGIPTGNYFMSTCDIDSGASGGPMVARVDYRNRAGGLDRVLRLFAINAAIDRGALVSKALSTGVIPLFRLWGTVAVHGHLEALRRLYGERIPLSVSATWRSLLEGWDRTTLVERRRRILAGFLRDADVPEALLELRKLEAEAGEAVVERYESTGLEFEGHQAPLVVKRVRPGSPADTAGLRAGDRVVAAADEAYPNALEFRQAVNASGGWPVLRIRRGQREETEVLRLRAR
jgi:membrane-associated protease RseP (regulator of RpoE activity)